MGERMFVILVYDINQKRVSKVMKICRKYLVHVQKSVFEGEITEARLKHMKAELKEVVSAEVDTICIYCMETMRYMWKEEIGLQIKNSNII